MPEVTTASEPELVPWLFPVWERLWQAQKSDRLPHALLLVGVRGIGKRWLAELLARSLLCAEPGSDGLACGHCVDCQLVRAGSHPDLLRVVPGPESKSGEIGIAAIRDLTERASLTAGRAARKFILIEPADRMSVGAANALLKTLEEPPGPIILCLIAELLGRLPATIRSRCQLIKLGVPPTEQALNWLGNRVDPVEKPHIRLGLSHGAPLRAYHGFSPETLEQHGHLRDSLMGIARQQRDPVTEAVAWNRAGAALSLEWLASWLCDLARLVEVGRDARLDDPQCSDILSGLGVGLDPAALHRLLHRVIGARALTDTTVNPQLLIESLLIEWSRLSIR